MVESTSTLDRMPHKRILPILRKRENQRLRGRTTDWRPGAWRTTQIKDKCLCCGPHSICLCNDFLFVFPFPFLKSSRKETCFPCSRHLPVLWLCSGRELGDLTPWGSEGSITSLITTVSRIPQKEDEREGRGRGILRETMSVRDVLSVYIVPHTELKD